MRTGSMCPACGAADLEPLAEIGAVPVMCGVTFADREEALASPRGRIDLAACPACAHVYSTAFDESLLDYDAEYDNSLYHSKIFEAYSDRLARRLAGAYDLAGKHVVDIGCGKGDFLVGLCRAAGCRGTGFDRSYDGRFSDPRVTFVRDFVDWGSAPALDFFVSRHVLEHLVDPWAFLAGIRQACGDRRVRGYLEVPDAIQDFERSGWDCIYPHVSYFSSTSFAGLAIRAGFAIVRLTRNFEGQFLSLEVGADADTPDEATVQGMGLRREREILAEFRRGYPETVTAWRGRLDAIGYERTALWGAGAKGVSFLNAVDPGASIGALVDLNPGKWHRYLPVTGHLVSPPDELPPHIDAVVITNPVYEREIGSALAGIGIDAAILVA